VRLPGWNIWRGLNAGEPLEGTPGRDPVNWSAFWEPPLTFPLEGSISSDPRSGPNRGAPWICSPLEDPGRTHGEDRRREPPE
jgi:hypothetical protein